MPWLHIDWDSNGGLREMELTDDDGEVIAIATNVQIRRDEAPYPIHMSHYGLPKKFASMDSGEMTIQFIIPSLSIFSDATAKESEVDTESSL